MESVGLSCHGHDRFQIVVCVCCRFQVLQVQRHSAVLCLTRMTACQVATHPLQAKTKQGYRWDQLPSCKCS